jgi:sirohydrochlorin ferrochelatase
MTAARHAIITGHGQPSEPEPAEAALADFAARVGRHLPDWQVRSATLAMPGALEAALTASAPNPVVYPMFMSEGWFTQVQLVKRLGGFPARMARPFGVDPGLPSLAATVLRGELRSQGWQAEETRLFLPAHGSGRSPNSARDTFAFADALSALVPFAEIRVAFVEQDPFLKDMAAGLGPCAISLPFFAARLGHVIDDVPDALDAAGFEGVRLDPIGCAPEAPALVASALSVFQG